MAALLVVLKFFTRDTLLDYSLPYMPTHLVLFYKTLGS
jgi:hypothetical protein